MKKTACLILAIVLMAVMIAGCAKRGTGSFR